MARNTGGAVILSTQPDTAWIRKNRDGWQKPQMQERAHFSFL